MTYLDLRDLASELRDMPDVDEDAEEILTDDADEDRANALRDLASELGSPTDGTYGAAADELAMIGDNYEPTLIAADDFEDYAQELAEDIGAIQEDAPWPVRHIDWQAAADELTQDYTDVKFAGADYMIRTW